MPIMHHTPQGDLFPSPGLPQWLPDEILFSLASRQHALSGRGLAAVTCRQLFGHSRLGSQHDLPCRIDHFVGSTQGLLGDAITIIRDHTILPFYLPFRTAADENDAYATMRSSAMGSLKYRLGILTSRFRAHHPLKACLDCLIEDQCHYGVAYWHLTHQFPGVWICPHHHALLRVSTMKSTGVGRFQWHLPTPDTLSPTRASGSSTIHRESQGVALQGLTNLAVMLAKLPPGFHFESQRLLETYHLALLQRDLRTPSGQIRMQRLAAEFVAAVSPLRGIPELAALPGTAQEAASQVGRLLRAPRSGTHPLRHLVLVQWLFGSWDSFWTAYVDPPRPIESASPSAPDTTGRAEAKHESDSRGTTFLSLLRDKGYSVTRAARETQIDTTTGMAWAARAGLTTARRPKRLTPNLRARLLSDLRKGLDKSAASSKYQLSVQTITTTLRTEVGLQDAWREAHKTAVLNAARTDWEQLIADHPLAGVKELRGLAPAVYARLYRNDRAWLANACERVPRVTLGNNVALDWDRRDEALALEVRQVALRLAQEDSSTKVTLWKLYQAIPELKARLGALHRLPLTERALAGVRRRRNLGG